MDYEYNSSDIVIPGEYDDIEVNKFSRPMKENVPEYLDWAKLDFIDTFNDKTVDKLERCIGFGQRIKISDNNMYSGDNYCFGPLHVTETSHEEKKLVSKVYSSYHSYDYERQNMINGALEMIQADMQKRSNRPPFYQDIVSCRDEVHEEYNAIESIGSFSDVKLKLDQHLNHHNLTDDDTTVINEKDMNEKGINEKYINEKDVKEKDMDEKDVNEKYISEKDISVSTRGEPNVRSADKTDVNESATNYPIQSSINRRGSSNFSRLTGYFKRRIEKTMASLFS